MGDAKSFGPIGAILLAAGASSRMGLVKQLLPWKSSTLLEHAIEQLNQTNIDSLAVVLGAHEREITRKVDFKKTEVVNNENWESGMASSIRAGLGFLLKKKPHLKGILITLVDQPLLDVKYYNSLINNIINSNGIVASSYQGKLGVPAIFGDRHFDELMRLEGDRGARFLLRGGQEKVAILDAQGLALDLDSKQEYDRIYEQYGRF